MRKFVSTVWALALLIAPAAGARAALYSGSLTSSGGLYVAGGSGTTGGTVGWLSGDAMIEWTVTDTDSSAPTGFPWKYTYTFSAYRKDISHIILETSEPTSTSPGFTAADITCLTGAVLEAGDPKVQTVGSGNPGMPEDVFGLRFLESTAGPSWTWSFYSTKAPVWGDFYAKDGRSQPGPVNNLAYNLGFTASDVDPADAPANGSVDWHILVPDSNIGSGSGGSPTPAPSSLVGLLGMGMLGLAILARRRRLSRRAA